MFIFNGMRFPLCPEFIAGPVLMGHSNENSLNKATMKTIFGADTGSVTGACNTQTPVLMTQSPND